MRRKIFLSRAAGAIVALAVAAPVAGAPAVTGLTASRGESGRHVSLKWTGTDAGGFTIERAARAAGPFVRIAETTVSHYRDTTAEPGLLHWYRVIPRSGSTEGVPAVATGYRSPPSPQTLLPSAILGTRTLDRPPAPTAPAARDLEERSLKYVAEYYEKPFMAWVIVTIGRLYVSRGDLLVYRDVPRWSWDHQAMTLAMTKPGEFHATFFSERFFRYVKWMDHYRIPREHLLKRSMANAIIYCVRAGDIEERRADGTVRYVPHLAVVGLSTEYFRDWMEWKSHSIVFASSDPELARRIREAWRQGVSGVD